MQLAMAAVSIALCVRSLCSLTFEIGKNYDLQHSSAAPLSVRLVGEDWWCILRFFKFQGFLLSESIHGQSKASLSATFRATD